MSRIPPTLKSIILNLILLTIIAFLSLVVLIQQSNINYLNHRNKTLEQENRNHLKDIYEKETEKIR